MKRGLFVICAFAWWVFASAAQSATLDDGARRAVALRVADFILGLQTADGAILDGPGSALVNEDSNMEYALIGLAAAYRATGDYRYLHGLEIGIRWLAAREEMIDPFWKGSWFLAYSSRPPYAPVPTSPGTGIRDARGVDATSALFVYLAYLHTRLTGQSFLAVEMADRCKAALNFALGRDEYGTIDTSFDGFDGIFPQGYIPWMFGYLSQNVYSYNWLLGKATADGSIVVNRTAYSLSAAVAGMAAPAVSQPTPIHTVNWLATAVFDAKDGSIRDTAKLGSAKNSNVAGFTVVSLLNFRPF